MEAGVRVGNKVVDCLDEFPEIILSHAPPSIVTKDARFLIARWDSNWRKCWRH